MSDVQNGYSQVLRPCGESWPPSGGLTHSSRVAGLTMADSADSSHVFFHFKYAQDYHLFLSQVHPKKGGCL